MSDPFGDPGEGKSVDDLVYADLNGSLLLISVHKETETIETTFGPNTAINADVAVLDGDLKGKVYNDALIFPRRLKAQLRDTIGGKVLGRLGQGEKKPGKTAPWLLNTATDADKETGRKYLAYVATQVPVTTPDASNEPF